MKFLLVISLAFLALFQMAWAEDPYVQAYKAYRNAMNNGAVEIAVDYAETAWREAEKAQIDPETIAVLAQNYVELILWSDPEKAVEPAERALALAEEGYGTQNYQPLELKVAVAAAHMGVTPHKRAKRKALEKALKEYTKEEILHTDIILVAYMKLASACFKHDDHRRNKWAATEAVKLLDQIEPLPKNYIIQMNIARVYAMLMSDLSSQSDRLKLKDALVVLYRTMSFFPPQKDIESFDPTLAELRGWLAAVNTILQTYEIEIEEDYEFEGRSIKDYKNHSILKERNLPEGVECNIKWVTQPQPSYPREASSRGVFGAAVLGYHLDATGRPQGARILAEVPKRGFGEASLKSLNQWEADVSELHENCFQNRTLAVHYLGPKFRNR